MEVFLAVLQELPGLGGVEMTLCACIAPRVCLWVAFHVLAVKPKRHCCKVTSLADKLDGGV